MHKIEVEKANEFIRKKIHEVIPTYRNHYHLMAPIGWINDPNGFVYFKGEYHLFFQYYPYDSVWGPMHWGHAKSKDLVHWESLPVALAPSEEYDINGCFSGSAIEKDGKLYLIYTGHVEEGEYRREVQCLAVSEDGIHFEKYVNNPIIAEEHIDGIGNIAEFRDPKVFQHEDIYYTIVASQTEDKRGQMLLFESIDLFEWRFKSVVAEGEANQGVMWECPDLFHLDGKDVLIFSPIEMEPLDYSYLNTSSTVVFIGEMDWETGKLAVENYHEIDYGLDFYAPQTCEGPNGERIMVAWMQMWHRTIPTHDLKHLWSGSMTLPRELHVKDNCLIQTPPKAIYDEFEEIISIEDQMIASGQISFADSVFNQQYIQLIVDIIEGQKITFLYAQDKESLRLEYDMSTSLLSFSRENMGYDIKGIEKKQLTKREVRIPLMDNQLKLEIFRDTSSVEIFTATGETMTFTFYEKEKGNHMHLQTSEGPLVIQKFKSSKISK